MFITSDKSAIVFCSNNIDTSVSYNRLNQEIENRTNKFVKNELVAFCDEISLELIFNYLAAINAGAIPCFVAHPSIKVSREVFEKRIANIVKLGFTKIVSSNPVYNRDITTIVDNSNIMFAQLSSGTTDNQKCFLFNREKLLKQIELYSRTIEFDETSTVVSWLPIYHDMGLFTSIFMPLFVGATTVIIPTFEWLFNQQTLFSKIDEYAGTHCWMPDSIFSMMGDNDFELNNKNCRFINCSEVCRRTSLIKFSKYTDNLYCCYAMAENVFAVAQSKKIDFSEESDILSSGFILDDVYLQIDDEIRISGSCLFDATLKDGKIITNKEKRYSTGDLGAIINNKLIVEGRKKDVCKIYGKQISLSDVDYEINKSKLCSSGRVVSFALIDDKERCVILFEGIKKNTTKIKQLIKELFDIECIVENIPKSKIIKTSSGKLSRELNKQLYLNRSIIREIIQVDMLEKGADTKITKLKSSGLYDSFELTNLISKIHFKLKKTINWSSDFKSLDTMESFVDAFG